MEPVSFSGRLSPPWTCNVQRPIIIPCPTSPILSTLEEPRHPWAATVFTVKYGDFPGARRRGAGRGDLAKGGVAEVEGLAPTDRSPHAYPARAAATNRVGAVSGAASARRAGYALRTRSWVAKVGESSSAKPVE